MVSPTTSIPNRPGQLVIVSYKRITRSPFTHENVEVPMNFVGASARKISCEAGEEAMSKVPVTWRFLQGNVSGDDDSTPGSEWDEWSVDVSPMSRDARLRLEKKAPGGETSGFEWYLFQREAGPGTGPADNQR